MKRLFSILIAVVATAAFAFAFGQAPSQPAYSKAEQDVLKTQDEVLRAMIEHDMAAVDRIYTDNYTFTGANGSVASKARLIELFKQMKANGATYLAWTRTEVKIALYGDSAVTNNRFEIKTRNSKGEVNTLNHRYTCTWVKVKGQWKLAAAQASEIKTTPPAQ